MRKKMLYILLGAALCLALLPGEARAATSGRCGDNLTWTLDNEGTLTISGTGAMENYYISYYSDSFYAPWYNFKKQIKTVIIGSGVTSIGSCAFYECSNLASVAIPNSVTSIEEYAFYCCDSLISMTIPNSVKNIEACVFMQCEKLENVTLYDGITHIDLGAFWFCPMLRRLDIPATVTSCDSMVDCADGWISSWDVPLDIYFYGSVAPACCSTFFDVYKASVAKVTIYYPSTASGWEAFQQLRDIKNAVDEGKIVFDTWTPTAAAPKITAHPESVTAAAGTTVTFTAAAQGMGLSYQWLYLIPDETRWRLPNGAGYSGYNTATLTVEAIAAYDGYSYRCIVSNTGGAAPTRPATLTVIGSDAPIPAVTGSVSGSVLTATVTAPKGALLIAASYGADGRQLGVTSVSIAAEATNRQYQITGLPAGGSYKLMLVSGTTFAPLCPAWNSK